MPIKQREVLEYVGAVEEAMVAGLTFDVPKEYADRPLLKVRAPGPAEPGAAVARRCSLWASGLGRTRRRPSRDPCTAPMHMPAPLPAPQGRATLEMKVSIRETPEGPQNPTLTIVLDGYNAPVSAGQVGGARWQRGALALLMQQPQATPPCCTLTPPPPTHTHTHTHTHTATTPVLRPGQPQVL